MSEARAGPSTNVEMTSATAAAKAWWLRCVLIGVTEVIDVVLFNLAALNASFALGKRTAGQLDVRNAREVAHPDLQRSAVRAVEIGAVDRPSEVGDEHAAALRIERQADALHQVIEHDLGRRALALRGVERRAVHRVAARRVTTVGPIQHASSRIDVQIDGLRQVLIEQLDVTAIRWSF